MANRIFKGDLIIVVCFFLEKRERTVVFMATT